MLKITSYLHQAYDYRLTPRNLANNELIPSPLATYK